MPKIDLSKVPESDMSVIVNLKGGREGEKYDSNKKEVQICRDR